MGRIQLLPDRLINQIAAGEVVERPASVVKELAENAIDAGARTVRIALGEGGLAAIQVIDDGSGMSREDAQLSLSRHATSKLADLEGLSHILTKGFRGEALPSIASVSRFSLRTALAGAPTGTRVVIEGGGPMQLEDIAPLVGTRIDVEDLFFNTPARRKFMRREATELSHCEEAVVRLMLGHPEVGFFLSHGGQSIFASPASAADPRERVAAALGAQVFPHLLPIEERRLGLRVEGFIASPEYTLPTARGLYTFVNRRYVRDRGLNFAVQRAYSEALPQGRQPVAIVFVELLPSEVDVNVHPQKLEVRFQNAREVQDAVGAAISRALATAPWRAGQSAPPSPEEQGAHYALAVERFLSRAEGGGPVLFEPREQGVGLGFGQARPGLNEAPPPGYFGALRLLGELGQRFWVCEGKGGSLVVVDPRAVRERLLLEALRRAADGQAGLGQGALFAQQATVRGKEISRVLAHAPLLERVGLEVVSFGPDTLAVRAVPQALAQVDAQALIAGLAEVLPAALGPFEEDTLAAVLRVLAALGAATAPLRTVAAEEAHGLLRKLDEADFSVPCTHPRVVVHEVPLLELAAR